MTKASSVFTVILNPVGTDPLTIADLKEARRVFEFELHVVRENAEMGLNSIHAFRSLRIASERTRLQKVLRSQWDFWYLTGNVFFYSAVMAMARILDMNDDAHSVHRLIKRAKANPDIFSKAELASRKKEITPDSLDWLEAYMESVPAFSHKDIRPLHQMIKKCEAIYKDKYAPIRHTCIAHSLFTTEAERFALLNDVDIVEMAEIFEFFVRMNSTMWDLLYNGMPPDHERYTNTAVTMRDQIFTATETVLRMIASTRTDLEDCDVD